MKRMACLIAAVLAAAALSQAPEYAQQYAQRLGGAVDELDTIIAQFDADAASFGLSRQEGLARYAESPDDFLNERGVSMQAVFARHAHLVAQQEQLRAAGPLERTLSVVRWFDTDVGAAALDAYKPAIPVTPEGFGHALAGFAAGYALLWGGWTAGAAPFRKRRTKVKISRIEPRI